MAAHNGCNLKLFYYTYITYTEAFKYIYMCVSMYVRKYVDYLSIHMGSDYSFYSGKFWYFTLVVTDGTTLQSLKSEINFTLLSIGFPIKV